MATDPAALHCVETHDLVICGYEASVRIPNVHPDHVRMVTRLLSELLTTGAEHAFTKQNIFKILNEEKGR